MGHVQIGSVEFNRNEKFLHVEDFDVAVVGGCAKKLRVGREGQRADRHGVAFERVEQLARLQVEDVHEAVDGRTRQVLAVGALFVKGALNINGQNRGLA